MRNRSLFFVLISTVWFMLSCMFVTGYVRKDGTYVYATAPELSYSENPIPGIDVQSFQVLSRHGYAKDADQVYYQYYLVDGADPGSFTEISDLYGRDNAHVYYKFFAIPGADPNSFELFNTQWGRDSKDIYLQDRPIEACDPATFVILREGWEQDNQCVYNGSAKLPDADPASFVVMNYWFGKDKNHVYYNDGSIIERADPSTFKAGVGKCEVCAEDKHGCYRYKEPLACEVIK